jgi:hypothetical protein
MSDLHTEGWRQGSVVSVELTTSHLTTVEGRIQEVVQAYSRWVVCTQDCDLRSANVGSHHPLIELRPVLAENPPSDWGIRSRRFLLGEGTYVDADTPRCVVTPALLNTLRSDREVLLDKARSRAFKTWLGLRYDRPAVPEHLVDLAREIARRCSGGRGRAISDQVHDVLMQFDDGVQPVRVALFAVIADGTDPQSVRVWLADVATRINSDLGVVAAVDVATRARTPLELVETSYAADLSQLTWSRNRPA